MILSQTLDFGDVLQSLTMAGAVMVACWKAARWQAVLDRDVRDGFRRNDERHAEIRHELVRHGDLLEEHGHHLAALDERTALLLRHPPPESF